MIQSLITTYKKVCVRACMRACVRACVRTVQPALRQVLLFLQYVGDPEIGHTHILTFPLLLLLLRGLTHQREPDAVQNHKRTIYPRLN